MKFQTYGKLTQLVVAAGLSTLLVSCGGTATDGMGGGAGSGNAAVDTNDDGVIDAADGDLNGDGLLTDADFDFNSDGLIDSSDDVNQDEVVNADDFDINGDGSTNATDDINNDGAVNLLDETAFGLPCKGNSGTVADGADPTWDNLCTLSETAYYANSSYSRGVQRILFCQGYADSNATFDTFADGAYGPATAAAVEAYQTAKTLTVDGSVGPETWGSLRSELVNLGTTGGTFDPYGVVNDVNCNNQAIFFEEYDAGSQAIGWKLSDVLGGTAQAAFSTTF